MKKLKQHDRCSLPFLLAASVCILLMLTSPLFAANRPNIVFVLADDLGFSDVGCYGGEIATPNLDRLARDGIRFTQMYNTGRCWPSRASLLSGYYAQQVNRDPARKRPAWAALLPELLKPAGYRSYHSGKWHIDGPVLKAGFDRSYWFQDWDRYFTPKEHYLDDRPLPPVERGENFYATTAMADRAIEFLEEHAREHGEQPFFLYLAFVAPHFPLHALPEDIERYKDTYLSGWDVVREQRWKRLRDSGIVDCELSPLDPALRPRYLKPNLLETIGEGEAAHAVPWNSLTPQQQRFQASKMAIHAAMIDRMDREIGRVFDHLARMQAWENTLIVFLSDNGADASLLVRGDGHDRAAAPGSAESFLCLGPGWASASNAPFRRHKIWVHEGGIATPSIVRWPQHNTNAGSLRHTPAHIIDFVPTVLELAGLENPEMLHEQKRPPLPGKSLTPTRDRDAMIARDYLYWHHEGNRALRVEDWKLVSEAEREGAWELYNLKHDRIEAHDRSAEQAQRVAAMAKLWHEIDDGFRSQSGTTLPSTRATRKSDVKSQLRRVSGGS